MQLFEMLQAYENELYTKENEERLKKFINQVFEVEMDALDTIPIETIRKVVNDTVKLAYKYVEK